MKKHLTIIACIMCVLMCFSKTSAQQNLEQRIQQLELQLQQLINENSQRETAYDQKLTTAKEEMTTRQQSFESVVNRRLNEMTTEQTQMRTDMTALISNKETQLTRLIDNSIPVGTVLGFFGRQPENLSNWKLLDGRTILTRGEFGSFFEFLQLPGDTFTLPDFSGRFLRGINVNANIDSEGIRRPGTFQEDLFKEHNHPASSSSNSSITPNPHTHTIDDDTPAGSGSSGKRGSEQGIGQNRELTTGTRLSVTTNTSTRVENSGGAETRPKNVAVYWIIKVK